MIVRVIGISYVETVEQYKSAGMHPLKKEIQGIEASHQTHRIGQGVRIHLVRTVIAPVIESIKSILQNTDQPASHKLYAIRVQPNVNCSS